MNDGNAAARVIQDLRGVVGAARAGARLPSVRELTARHHASPVTVAAAIRALVKEGLVETRPGQGTFVARRATVSERAPDLTWQTVALGARRPGEHELGALLAIPPAGAIPLSGGYLEPELQPAAALGAALARVARQPAAWQRGPAEGREDLRAWFAGEVGLRADDMVICPGGQAALSSALRALAAPGDTLLVESPTYLGALAAARAAGLHVVPVPADADGVLPDQLAAAFRRTGARLFYCQPLHANPTGATLAADRRGVVLSAVREAGAFVIEDDYARDLTIDGNPPPPLAWDDVDGHVIYLRSLTKSAAPGLRIAAIGARGPAGARLRTVRLSDELFVAGPLQQAALEFVTSPAWDRHRRHLRTALRVRRDALLSALHRHLPATAVPTHIGGRDVAAGSAPMLTGGPEVPAGSAPVLTGGPGVAAGPAPILGGGPARSSAAASTPKGGLHLWLRLDDGFDDVGVAAAAAANGVVVFPGRPWFAAEAPAPHLRLTYAAAPPELMDEAVRRLSAAIAASRPTS